MTTETPAPSAADSAPAATPKTPRRRRSREERIAELDGKIAKLRAQASRERRRAETARLLRWGRAVEDALGRESNVKPEDLARWLTLGRVATVEHDRLQAEQTTARALIAQGDSLAAWVQDWAEYVDEIYDMLPPEADHLDMPTRFPPSPPKPGADDGSSAA